MNSLSDIIDYMINAEERKHRSSVVPSDLREITEADPDEYGSIASVKDFVTLKLPGGPIKRFETPPVATGRYNFGVDNPTLHRPPKGSVDQDDPDAVSPGPKYSNLLFVVDPSDRSDPDLEPRAALQNSIPHDNSKSEDIFGVIGDDVPAYIDAYVHKSYLSSGIGGEVVILATAYPTEFGKNPDDNLYPTDTEFIRYGHLDSRAVETGDEVEAGEIIGKLGCTGNCGTLATVPHIHLTVSGTNSIGKYRYYKGNRDILPLFDQSGWVTNEKDLWIASESRNRKITRRQLRRLIAEEILKRSYHS